MNLYKIIKENKHLLKPPVNNMLLFDSSDFIVMLVGGPNQRSDFHINPYEEIFIQLEGILILTTIENNERKIQTLSNGDMAIVSGGTPHQPKRLANSVGIVIERKRKENELDGFSWYCECGKLLYHVDIHVYDIVNQLADILKEQSNFKCDCKQL